MAPRAIRLRTSCAAAVIALALVACGSDGPAANLPSATIGDGVAAPPPDEPAVTEAPAEPAEPEQPEAPVEPEAPVTAEPAPVEPAPNPVAPDDDDVLRGFITLLAIFGLIAVVVLIGAAIAKSRKKAPAPAAAVPAAAPSPKSSLLSTSQWIADQLSLELMAAPPSDALQRWSVERSRLDNVAIGAQEQFLAGQDPNWQQLAQTMPSLASSLDTSLALRAQVPPNAQLISESINVVNGNRARLHQLIAALLPTIDR